jgi:hypothetical protein
VRVGAGPMSATLVLPQELARSLSAAALTPLETAGVLLVSIIGDRDSDIRLLGRSMHWVHDSAYRQREQASLSISSHGYVPALAQAELLGATPLWVHTHPGLDGLPLSSEDDDVVDQQLSDVFRTRAHTRYYGSLILSPRPHGFAFSGFLELESGRRIRLRRLWLVGDRLQLSRSFDSSLPRLQPHFDRNVRAFGGAIQQTLSDIRVAVVGCGGTGSVVAEQLVRLGVRQFTLIDPDKLSESNVTRVYGSTPSAVGRPKVDVLAEHLGRIAPAAQLDPVRSMINAQDAARRLTTCDAIFGCTDDNAGRLVLSRAATYLLTPVIDSGVVLTSDHGGHLTGIDGRVTVLVPGQACLVCRGRIDLARASAEVLTPDERVRREDEGYAPALGRIEPAVVAFTTAVGAAAVGEFLERLIGYGPEPRPSEVLLRCHEREISTNIVAPGEHHYCHPSSGKLGIGLTEPFLEQAWSR